MKDGIVGAKKINLMLGTMLAVQYFINILACEMHLYNDPCKERVIDHVFLKCSSGIIERDVDSYVAF